MKKRSTPRRGAAAAWTVQRATGAGLLCGLGAIVTGLLAGASPALNYLYAALVLLTLLCGLSALWITLWDIRTRGRGGRMRPIRAFDLILGGGLSLLAAYALVRLWPTL